MPKFRFEFLESAAQPKIHVEMENLQTAKAETKRAAARVDIRGHEHLLQVGRRALVVALVGLGGFLDLAPIVAVAPHKFPRLRR